MQAHVTHLDSLKKEGSTVTVIEPKTVKEVEAEESSKTEIRGVSSCSKLPC